MVPLDAPNFESIDWIAILRPHGAGGRGGGGNSGHLRIHPNTRVVRRLLALESDTESTIPYPSSPHVFSSHG